MRTPEPIQSASDSNISVGELRQRLSDPRLTIVDVRDLPAYNGWRLGGTARGGHIPGAKSMPWKTATNDDGTFKPASELAKIYLDQCGVTPGTETIVYCRIGERSSHTWFVLTYLLGLNNVRNYDGSWTEWGNKVGAPIEKGV